MIELVLHPGHSKCGSTSIQRALLRNRRELEKQGAFMPDSQFRFSFEEGFRSLDDTPRGYFKNIHEAKDEEQLNKLLIAFDERLHFLHDVSQKHNVKKIIVSAENLINKLSQKHGYAIHEILAKNFDCVTVIYCIRPEDEFIQSSWQQWDHKHGISFKEYLSRCVINGMPNYFFIATTLARIYKHKNIRVVPINLLRKTNRNLIRLFFIEAKVAIRKINTTNEVLNETLNPFICNVAANIDGLYESPHDQNVKKILSEFIKDNPLLNKSSYKFITSEQRLQVRECFSERTRKLFDKFINDFSFDDFYSERNDEEDDSDLQTIKAYEELLMTFIKEIVRTYNNKG